MTCEIALVAVKIFGAALLFLALAHLVDWLSCYFSKKKDDLEGEDYGA